MDSSPLSLALSAPPHRSASATLRPLVLEPMRAHPGIEPVLLDGRKVVVGAADDCSLRLPVPGVEPRHCLILAGPHGPIVKAWDQRTWLNDRPVREAGLRDGDRLAIGPVVMRVRKAREDEAVQPPRSVEPAPAESRFEAPPTVRPPVADVPPPLPPVAAIVNPVVPLPPLSPLPPAAAPAGDPDREARRKRLLALRARRTAVARNEAEANDLLSQLVLRRQELEQRSARLDGLEGRIRDAMTPHERELSEKQVLLASERARLDSLDAALVARRAEVERREQEVEERIRRADNAEQLSARASASLARKRGLVSDLAGELLTHQGTIETQRRAIDHDRRTAQQQLAEAAARLAEAASQEADVRRQLDELAMRETILSTRAAGVEKQQRELSDEVERVAGQRTRLEARSKELDAREQSLETREADIARRDAELGLRTRQGEEERERLAGLERDLNSRLLAIHESDARLQALNTNLTGRAAELTARETELVRREQEISRTADSVEVRLAEIDRRSSELDTLRRDLDERTARLFDLETELARTKTAAAEREHQLAEREASLAESEERLAAQTNLAQTRKAELDARSAELDGRTAQVAAEREELDRIRLEQDQVRAELSARREELEVSQRDLSEVREEMDREMARLAAEEQRLDERNEELRRREQDLEDRLDLVSQRDAGLDRERLLADADSRISSESVKTADIHAEELAAREERIRAQESQLAEEHARLDEQARELELARRELETRRQNLASIAALVGPAESPLDASPSHSETADEARLAARQAELETMATEAAQRVTELETREAALIEQEAVLEAARTAAAELQSRLAQESQHLDADRASVEAERLAVEADRRVLDRQAEALNDQELRLTSRENELRSREERYHTTQPNSFGTFDNLPEPVEAAGAISVDRLASAEIDEPVVDESSQTDVWAGAAVPEASPEATVNEAGKVDEPIRPMLELEPVAETVSEVEPNPMGDIGTIVPDQVTEEILDQAEASEAPVLDVVSNVAAAANRIDESDPIAGIEAEQLAVADPAGPSLIPVDSNIVATDSNEPQVDGLIPSLLDHALVQDVEKANPVLEGRDEQTDDDVGESVVPEVAPVESSFFGLDLAGREEVDAGSLADGPVPTDDFPSQPVDNADSLLRGLNTLDLLTAGCDEGVPDSGAPAFANAPEPADRLAMDGPSDVDDPVCPPVTAEPEAAAIVGMPDDVESVDASLTLDDDEKRQLQNLEARLRSERAELEALEQRWRNPTHVEPPVSMVPPVYGVNPFGSGVIFPGTPLSNSPAPIPPEADSVGTKQAGDAAVSPATGVAGGIPVATASSGLAGGGGFSFGMASGAVAPMVAMPTPTMEPGSVAASGSVQVGAPGLPQPAPMLLPPSIQQQQFAVIPMLAPPAGFVPGGFLQQIPSSDLPPTIKEEVPRPKSEPYMPKESGPLINSNSALGLPSELESLPHLDLSDDTAMLLGEASRMDEVDDLAQLGLETESHIALAENSDQGALLSEDDLAELQDSHTTSVTPKPVATDGSVRSLLAEMFGIEHLGQEAHHDDAGSPETSESESATAPSSTDQEDRQTEPAGEMSDDDTIAEYMERLLARSRRGSSDESTVVVPAMVPSMEASRQTIAPAETPSVEDLDLSHLTGTESVVVPVHPVGPMVPRAKVNPNELRIRNEYLREVANRSARLALARHRQRQQRSARLFKGTVAVASLALGGSIFGGLVGGGDLRTLYGIVALGISAFMGGSLSLDIWQIRKIRRSANQERRPSSGNKAAAEESSLSSDHAQGNSEPAADAAENHDTTAIIHQAVVAAEQANTTEQ